MTFADKRSAHLISGLQIEGIHVGGVFSDQMRDQLQCVCLDPDKLSDRAIWARRNIPNVDEFLRATVKNTEDRSKIDRVINQAMTMKRTMKTEVTRTVKLP